MTTIRPSIMPAPGPFIGRSRIASFTALTMLAIAPLRPAAADEATASGEEEAAPQSIESLVESAGANGSEIRAFLESAAGEFGETGRRAAEHLVRGMPPKDLASLTSEFLTENLRLAMKAREEFPWAREIPEHLFLNDVVPYAALDERRESWRPDFYEKAKILVEEAGSATEAAQALNRDFFNLINVHYNTGRKRPNQSPSESIEQGRATCTGLSIILAYACRAVGIPARVVGTPMWTNKRGNHTWVEIWDGDWHFTGADEYDAGGLNRGWFVGDASQARSDPPEHAIYASSWTPGAVSFPLVWNRDDASVPAVDVTARYAVPAGDGEDEASDAGRVFVRVLDRPGGERIAVKAELLEHGDGQVLASDVTRAGTADLNDMAAFTLEPDREYSLRLVREEPPETRLLHLAGPDDGPHTLEVAWSELPDADAGDFVSVVDALRAWLAIPPALRPALSTEWESDTPLDRSEAETALEILWKEHRRAIAAARSAELEEARITVGDHTLRLLEMTFGEEPPTGRSLWISMHGGGGAPTRVNDQQWRNQIRLYEPAEGIYVAPRAPTDTWNLWHQAHIDSLFDRLIEIYVALRNVDPNRVYLMGYSAGGDGVYQLAPRMADRFAAAAMMAGHPNDASPLGLRNLPFALFMGGDDAAYNRNQVAAEWGRRLGDLQAADPDGYPHRVTIYAETGHWMNGRDAEALPWMTQYSRNPWPAKVVWHQSGVTHDRFYWLAVPEGTAAPGATVNAAVDGSTISVAGPPGTRLILRLSDQLVDLDQPIRVVSGEVVLFEGSAPRTVAAIRTSLDQRADPRSAATASLEVMLPAPAAASSTP